MLLTCLHKNQNTATLDVRHHDQENRLVQSYLHSLHQPMDVFESRPLFVHGQTEQQYVAFFIFLSHLNRNIAASDSSTILSEQSHIRNFCICIFQNFVQTRFKNHQKRKIINLNLHPKTIKLYVHSHGLDQSVTLNMP